MTRARLYDQPATYQITVYGRLDPDWSIWFDSLTIETATNDVTLITGTIVDQAGLHGLLARIRDLGLPLLRVERQDIPDPALRTTA